MNLTSPSQVKAWCIASDFHPNKVLGQNFLVDLNAVKAIVDAGLGTGESPNRRMIESDSRPADHSIIRLFDYSINPPNVLEIGPGLGVLTEELLARGCRVTAVEKDPTLAARLAEALGNPPNLAVVADDALDWLGRMKRDPDAPRFTHMISNLPYQAGTRILLELLQLRAVPALTVLVQTEVAERLAAGPGSKVRGLAGVWAQLDYDVRVVRKVSASCFWPRPAVGSSVVRLDLHGRNAGLSEEVRRAFRGVTKRAFEHRRKQLGGVFRGEVVSTARAEELSNGDWVAMAEAFAAGMTPFVV